jgi:hypothetical protein
MSSASIMSLPKTTVMYAGKITQSPLLYRVRWTLLEVFGNERKDIDGRVGVVAGALGKCTYFMMP